MAVWGLFNLRVTFFLAHKALPFANAAEMHRVPSTCRNSFMKKVAILQSNYIPWKGYFDMIAAVDEFILYDDMQYTKNDWRNRNKIKCHDGLRWLTVPVGQNISRKISEVKLTDPSWQTKHWKSLVQNYHAAPCFAEVSTWLEPMYSSTEYSSLSSLNRCFLQTISAYLGIQTKISNSSDYTLIEGKTERLADLCAQAGATEYISGPAAQNYLDPAVFDAYKIQLTWFDYIGYKEYPQLHGNFEHGVSILDLLFNCGKDSANYMRFVNR